MTTLPRYNEFEQILSRLDDVRARRWMLNVLAGSAAAVTIIAAVLLTATVLLGYWSGQPPQALRWIALSMLAASAVGSLAWFVARPFVLRENPAQVARYVEQGIPQVRNDLINSVLLADDTRQSSPELVRMAIGESLRRTRNVDLNKSIPLAPLKRWAAAAGAAILLLGGFIFLQPGPFRRGLSGILPWRYVPTGGSVELVGISPGDTTRFAGEPLTISATIRNDEGLRPAGRVLVKGRDKPHRMNADYNWRTYTHRLDSVNETLHYAVQVGDSRWPVDRPYYTVTVLKQVEVKGLDARYEYPGYIGKAPETVENFDGMVRAPQGSRADITVRLAAPVNSAVLDIRGRDAALMSASTDHTRFTTTLAVNEDGAYRIILKDASGHTIQQIPDDEDAAAGGPVGEKYFSITAVKDAPPRIKFLTPNRDAAAAPGDELPTRVKIYDKYALKAATLYAGPEGGQLSPVHKYDAAGTQGGRFDYTFDLANYVDGDVLTYYAAATDNRNLPGVGGPQTTATPRFKITIRRGDKLAAENARLHKQLRRLLTKILRMQEAQRRSTEYCLKSYQTVEKIAAAGAEIQAAQKKIRGEMVNVVENFDFSADTAGVQKALAELAKNQAPLAVEQAGVVAALESVSSRGTACRPLAGTQDEIIDALQLLLAMLPSLDESDIGEKSDIAGDDLPDRVKQKKEELAKDLEKFIEQQRKVIEAGERLAKKPLDDLTAADMKQLKELAALEDKWEKFFNESIADFSKLLKQDFSNPSMLKEIQSVKADITMAKDALSREAVEIAVAAAESAVDKAEELESNLEKWLPDVPDREKWAMETPTGGQDNIEMPELSSELVDMVGDLLEQEEDLFEEMQDVSARAGMAGEGMGWDAKDGPMSSMGAQGVTGNQLPNNSEIGGRSGEGRTGKSTGEFVGKEAVGKGGRRTPSRLSPEPFQQGQIDDTSTQPPGGASGGGKLSGAGAEGLEGPVPAPLKQEMPRLAQKQAALHNRAERIRAQFSAGDYSNFRFLQAITLMDRVRRDLENNRYYNALRARDEVIGALKETHTMLDEGVDVTADTSAAMPKHIRNDVADAMKGKLPEQYRPALEQFYRRLSQEGDQ